MPSRDASRRLPALSLGVVALVGHPFLRPMSGLSAQAPPAAMVPSAEPLERAARLALVASARHPAMRWPRLTDVRHSLRALYDSTSTAPLWLQGGVPTAQARALLAVLGDAASYGLDPTDFDAGRLPALAANLETPQQRASFDVALSATALRFLRSVHEGRVDPTQLHPGLRMPRTAFDAAAAVRALATSADVAATVRTHEPALVHYQLVKASLARFRALAADADLTRLPPLPRGASVREGDRWEGTPRLVRLLAALEAATLGHASAADDPTRASDSLLVSPAIAEAIRRFQRRGGLEADAVLGRLTHAALTRPVTEQVRALAFTLERMRWLPRTFDAPPLIVNIPAFRLYVFTSPADDEREMLRMDVVVGQAVKTETPVFHDTLTTVVFAPYWDVPRSILTKEILPKARRDPGYLARHHYEAVRGDADDSPVLGAGAGALAALEAGTARLRQRPGPDNALRHLKVLVPNPYNVYLHDTPSQSVFLRARRDASHGCIRIANPVGLAQLLLADQPEWTDDRIAEAMARDRPLYVRVRRPRPVFILYATAMATQDGETRFYPDLYGHDADLARRLDAGFPYRTEPAPRVAR